MPLTPVLDSVPLPAVPPVPPRQALASSPGWFQVFVEESPDIVTILGADGVVLYESPACERVTGWPADELVGRDPFEFIHPDDHERVFGAFAQGVLSQTRFRNVEYRFQHKNGSWITLESVGTNLLDEPGIRGVVVVSRDVTARKRDEERRALIMRAARCILWDAYVTQVGPCTYAWDLAISDALTARKFVPAEMLNLRTDGIAWGDAIHPDDRGPAYAVFLRAIESGSPGYAHEFRLRSLDGEHRWLNEEVQIASLGPGRWHLVGVCTDTTRRKRAEARTAVFSELGRRLNEATSPWMAAAIIFDAATDLFAWDAGLLNLLSDDGSQMSSVMLMDTIGGVRREVPQRFSGLPVSPTMKTAIAEGAQLVLREPDALAGDASMPSADAFGDCGRPSASLMFAPVRSQGKAVGILSIQSYLPHAYGDDDLRTLQSLADHCGGALERIEAERSRQVLHEQLVHAQKMESVGRLAGGVAHDFNNLLTAIMGFTEMAASLLEEDHPAARMLQSSQDAAGRAAILTRQLLTFARKQVTDVQLVDVGGLVRDVTKILQRLIGEDVTLVTRVDPAAAPVRADGSQIEQVLVNLAVNGRDAMPDGGTLTVEVGPALLAEDERRRDGRVLPAGRYTRLTVSDTGHGMTEEVRQRVFEPFYTTKQIGHGTGLGLSTCYGIVQQAGGHIFVDSEPGEGAVFDIYLPQAEETAHESGGNEAQGSPSGRGSERILLVEDEAMVRAMTAQVLRAHGYTVLEAADGLEAIEVACALDEPVDLLLTDVVMPRMGGRVLAERMRVLDPATRVLYTSGYADGEFTSVADLGPDAGFLRKPFTSKEIAAAVRELLDRARASAG